MIVNIEIIILTFTFVSYLSGNEDFEMINGSGTCSFEINSREWETYSNKKV